MVFLRGTTFSLHNAVSKLKYHGHLNRRTPAELCFGHPINKNKSKHSGFSNALATSHTSLNFALQYASNNGQEDRDWLKLTILCPTLSWDYLLGITACILNGQSPRCYSQYKKTDCLWDWTWNKWERIWSTFTDRFSCLFVVNSYTQYTLGLVRGGNFSCETI
jgi:hypothetical protein